MRICKSEFAQHLIYLNEVHCTCVWLFCLHDQNAVLTIIWEFNITDADSDNCESQMNLKGRCM